MRRPSPWAWRMLAEERAAGRWPIVPGPDVPNWFDPADWQGWPVLSIDGAARELHIVAVWSARAGAFSRLLASATAAGLTPVVVAPFPVMVSILARWGWTRAVIGKGWTAREEWRPGPRGWHGD